MDFLTYKQTLNNELLRLNIPQDTIHTIVTQEAALAEIKNANELQSFFTIERISNILSLVKQSQTSLAPLIQDEEKTILPQSTQQSRQDEEKTILPTTSKATIQALADEATLVVISGASHQAPEEKTIAASPTLQKLLSENETVRISEKDTTAFFPNDIDQKVVISAENTSTHLQSINEEATTPIPSNIEEATIPISHIHEEATVAIPKPISHATITEATVPLHTPQIAHNKPTNEVTTPSTVSSVKKAVNQASISETTGPAKTAPNTPKQSTAIPLSPETLRNPHPHLAFVWLAFLLVPSIGLFTILAMSFILIANLLFAFVFVLVMLIYLSFLLIPIFLSLYSVFFACLYWKDSRIAEGITELGLSLFSSGNAILLGYLFYRPFVVATEWIAIKSKTFNKKTFLLIRNLYRYSVKGTEKL